MKKKADKPKKRELPERAPNIYDLLMRITDAAYDLINNGNILGLLSFGSLVFVFFLAHKTPSPDTGKICLEIISLMKTDRFYIFPLGTFLAISFVVNIAQKIVYTAEIKRLTEQRSKLIHGTESGELKPLDDHTPSGFDLNK